MAAVLRSRRRALRNPLARFSHLGAGSARLFDFWAAHLHPTWTWARPLARIVAREQAAEDAVTLWLRPNRHWRNFQPGQHLNVSAEVDGVRVTRSYSLCTPPRADRRIAITVKRIDGGRLSTHLCERARVGDVLQLGPAFGQMVLPDGAPSPRVLLAAGSGITPMIAMVRALAARDVPAPLTLLYGARTRAQLCFVEELRALARAHPAFKVRFFLTRDAVRDDDEIAGRIDAAQIARVVGDLSGVAVDACGPGAFVDAMHAACGKSAPFRSEAFTPPPREIRDEGEATVTLARSGRSLQVARGSTLLDALESAGLRPASGCRMGICNTCACGKRSGSVRNLRTGDLAHEPSSALKLCIHGAASDLVLDL